MMAKDKKMMLLIFGRFFQWDPMGRKNTISSRVLLKRQQSYTISINNFAESENTMVGLYYI